MDFKNIFFFFSCVWCNDECKWLSCDREHSPYKRDRTARFNHGFSEGNSKENDKDIPGHNRKQEISIQTGSSQPGFTGMALPVVEFLGYKI